jgi:hypothetical protein
MQSKTDYPLLMTNWQASIVEIRLIKPKHSKIKQTVNTIFTSDVVLESQSEQEKSDKKAVPCKSVLVLFKERHLGL